MKNLFSDFERTLKKSLHLEAFGKRLQPERKFLVFWRKFFFNYKIIKLSSLEKQ